MIVSNTPHEEVKLLLTKNKSEDFVDFTCFECGVRFRITKRRALTKLANAGRFWCTHSCSCKTKRKETYSFVSCLQCGTKFEKNNKQIEKHPNNFCSHSCSATYNNQRRPPPSEEQRRKVSQSLRSNYSDIKSIKECQFCSGQYRSSKTTSKYCSKACYYAATGRKPVGENKRVKEFVAPHCKIFIKMCDFCLTPFVSRTRERKNCSKPCQISNQSTKQSAWLSKQENRKNLGRGKKSWMEQSFEAWLIERNIPHESEVCFRNNELGKTYFVDFLFRQLNLIIELDGSQHRHTVEQDAIRDEYLFRVYGYRVVRITHKEYQKQLRYAEICGLLNIPDDRVVP